MTTSRQRHTGFDLTGSSTVRSVNPQNPTLPYHQISSGSDDPLQSYGYLKFSKVRGHRLVDWSVINMHTSYTDVIILLFATLGT